MVAGWASPDDPDLSGYWETRRNRASPLTSSYHAHLLARQHRCCPLCGDPLITPDRMPQGLAEWQSWWLSVAVRKIRHAPRTAGFLPQPGTPENTTTCLTHTSCNRASQARPPRSTALLPATP
jgi:RNA-directed DNA polymerase